MCSCYNLQFCQHQSLYWTSVHHQHAIEAYFIRGSGLHTVYSRASVTNKASSSPRLNMGFPFVTSIIDKAPKIKDNALLIQNIHSRLGLLSGTVSLRHLQNKSYVCHKEIADFRIASNTLERTLSIHTIRNRRCREIGSLANIRARNGGSWEVQFL